MKKFFFTLPNDFENVALMPFWIVAVELYLRENAVCAYFIGAAMKRKLRSRALGNDTEQTIRAHLNWSPTSCDRPFVYSLKTIITTTRAHCDNMILYRVWKINIYQRNTLNFDKPHTTVLYWLLCNFNAKTRHFAAGKTTVFRVGSRVMRQVSSA